MSTSGIIFYYSEQLKQSEFQSGTRAFNLQEQAFQIAILSDTFITANPKLQKKQIKVDWKLGIFHLHYRDMA